MSKGNRNYLRDVKVIPGKLQHRCVVVDLVKKKGKKMVYDLWNFGKYAIQSTSTVQ